MNTKRETADEFAARRRKEWAAWREAVKASPLYGTLGRGVSMCDVILPCPNCAHKRGARPR